MQSTMAVNSRLAAVLGRHFSLPEASFQEDSGPTNNDVEGWDSFSHVVLILEVEDVFGVKFSAEEISSLDSPAKIEARLVELGKL